MLTVTICTATWSETPVSGAGFGKRRWAAATLLQAGIHALDIMRQFMPALPVEVTAYGHTHAAEYTGDPTAQYEFPPTLVAVVKFADGAVARVTSSFETSMPYQVNLRLYGTQGSIQNNKFWSEVCRPGHNEWGEFPALAVDGGDPSDFPFKPMVDHIVDCILEDRPAFPDIRDALKSHELAFAADISAAEGRPVRLPL